MRSPFLRRAVAGAGVLGLAVVGVTSRSGAQASFYYEVAASATPVYVSIERESYVLNPILQANPLSTRADANSSGTRHGFASLADPGPIANFPGLLGLAISGLPRIPYPGYPLSVDADYPNVTEKHIGVGAFPVYDADRLDTGAFGAGAVFAQAKAAEDAASGVALAGSLSLGGGVVNIDGLRSSSRVEEDGGQARATARTEVSGIDVLGGIVEISGVESVTEVTASSSGTKTSSSLTVGGVKALGAEAVIDDKGIRITGLPGVPDLPSVSLDRLNKDLTSQLSQAGLTIRLIDGGDAEAPPDSASKASQTGSALEISYALVVPASVPIPNIPGVPLGIPAGGGIPTVATFSVARSSASGVSGALTDFGGGDTAGSAAADAGAGTDALGADALGGTGASTGGDLLGGADDLGGGTALGASPSGAAGSSGVTSGSPTGGGVTAAAGPDVALTGQRTASFTGSFGWVLVLAIASAIAVASQTRRRVTRLRAIPWRTWIEANPPRRRR